MHSCPSCGNVLDACTICFSCSHTLVGSLAASKSDRAAIDVIGKSVAFCEVVWSCVSLYEMSMDGQ